MTLKQLACSSIVLLATCLIAPNLGMADEKGQAKLDEATSLKLSATTPAKLAEVIRLCEEALKEGLDEDGKGIAKDILSAAAMDRAKAMIQQLASVARNRNAVRRLKTDAQTDLKKAIDATPDQAEPYLLAAQVALLPESDLAEALTYTNKAIELLKDNPAELSAAYLFRARMLRRDDEVEARLEDAKLATEADPSNTDAWRIKIALEASNGKLDEAYKDIQTLLGKEGDNDFAVQAGFEVLIQLGKHDELIALLTKQIEAKPENALYYRLRAVANIVKAAAKNEKDLLNTAKVDLDKALQLDPRDAQALIRRAEVLFDLGEIELARRDISDALLIEPQSVDGVYLRSIIAGREKRYGDAIADLELLVRAFPTQTRYALQLASYYQLDERPRLAIRLLDELLKQNKNSASILRQRGDAKLSVGEHAEAIKDYEAALKILDSTTAADDKKEDEDDEKTIKMSESELRREKAGVLNNLAWVLATSPKDEVRDGKRSLEYGLKASELTEYKEAHILSTLAAGYAETGNFEKAKEWSAKAVEVGSEDGAEQLDQLKQELENYKAGKPWREEQKTEEKQRQRKKAETIET